jgi:hypothetical protein
MMKVYTLRLLAWKMNGTMSNDSDTFTETTGGTPAHLGNSEFFRVFRGQYSGRFVGENIMYRCSAQRLPNMVGSPYDRVRYSS